MNQPEKLPLAQKSLEILLGQLNENDLVSVVTYAGATREVLPPLMAKLVDLTDKTREELYELARDASIAGRSSMTKQELARALTRTRGR